MKERKDLTPEERAEVEAIIFGGCMVAIGAIILLLFVLIAL